MTVNNCGAIDNEQGNLVNGGGSRTTIAAGGAVTWLGGTTMELNGLSYLLIYVRSLAR